MLPAVETVMYNDSTWPRVNHNANGLRPRLDLYTAGVFAPASLNVGEVGSWADPGTSNAWITGPTGMRRVTPEAALHQLCRGPYLRIDAVAGVVEAGSL